MRASFTPLCATCLILLLGSLVLSCSNGSGPVLPSDNSHDTLSSEFSGMEEPSGSFDIPPGYPHPSDGPDFAPDEVLVVFTEEFLPLDQDKNILPGSQVTLETFLSEHSLSVIKPIRTDWAMVYLLKITDNKAVPDKIDELKARAEVRFADPNGRIHFLNAPYVPNDPLWENPDDNDEDPRTNVFEQFGPSKTGASYVWDVTQGDGVIVCVIDTGIQAWHEDLEANMWINEGEIPDNDTDDDDNGYIDDIYGWDAYGNDPDITDTGGGSRHGTACAGVVAATMDNNLGCTGMAPGAKLMGIRIGFTSSFVSQVVEGVQYAMDNGADIITMSFISSGDNDTMRNTMDAAYEAGLVLVAGAGNDEGQWVYYPCSWDNSVKVGATSPFGPRWAYAPIDEERLSYANGFGWGSTYGNGQELMAYGEHYITTYGAAADRYWDGEDDFFFGGTSNATPMVAGAFALLKSYFPDETAEWYRIRMRETADDLHTQGYDSHSGYGRINLIRAIHGSDRYAAEEDLYGFVDLNVHDGFVVDSLNAVTNYDYVDNVDLYKFTTLESGYFAADLNIFTYGADFDIQVYSDHSLAPEFLVDQATGENHSADTHEVVGGQAEEGETLYFKIYAAPNTGTASAYDLKVINVQNTLEIETGNLDPGFVHEEADEAPVGWISLSAGYRVNLSEIIISQLGDMPTSTLAGIHLYSDTNQTMTFDGGDTLIADASFNGTNRARLNGFNEEINFANSPMYFFVTIDLEGIVQNTEYQLALTSYKDVATVEGVIVAEYEFPRYFGPFMVGVDVEAPTWNSTIGIQDAVVMYAAAQLYWNIASDPLTPPVRYNVYWTDTLPFDFGTADFRNNVNSSGGGDFDRTWKLTGLTNDQEYFVAIRAEDQAGNEDDNTVYLSVTPSSVSDPYNPQIIGSYNTTGNSWEVKADPLNQRVFIADYNAGIVIVDVSDPTSPELAGYVSGPVVTGVDYDGTYAYGAASNGVMIVDPDGGDGPELVTTVSFADALDVQYYENFVYATNTANRILPINVTDPHNPITYSVVATGYTGYGMDAQDGYLYVASNSGPFVYDLTDPTHPANTGADFGTTYAYEVDAVGDRLYITYWFLDRFSVYSLADPANPSYVALWNSENGVDASDVTMFNDRLYFGLNYRHIECLNVDSLGDIWRYGFVRTGGPDGLDSDENFVYSAENNDGLRIIL